jgi:hypothetical protein
VDLEVEVGSGERWSRTRARNASLGGIFLDAADLTPGNRVLLRVHLPGHTVEVGGQVRWQDAAGAGVSFDGLRAKDVWALGKYFESRSSR